MNVKELKELIKDLPDETAICLNEAITPDEPIFREVIDNYTLEGDYEREGYLNENNEEDFLTGPFLVLTTSKCVDVDPTEYWDYVEMKENMASNDACKDCGKPLGSCESCANTYDYKLLNEHEIDKKSCFAKEHSCSDCLDISLKCNCKN